MTKVDIVSLCVASMIVGVTAGLSVSHDVSRYVGKLDAATHAKEKAVQWAKNELIAHCPSWFTDKRKNDYMACRKPEWMHE